MKKPILRLTLSAWIVAHGVAVAPYTWGAGLVGGGPVVTDGGPIGPVEAAPASLAAGGAAAALSNAVFRFFPQAGTLW